MVASLPILGKASHISHILRCITGLPGSKADLDTTRLGIAYYCLSALDLLGVLDEETKVSASDRGEWRDWIWALSVHGKHGFGFRPGSSLVLPSHTDMETRARYDPPHLIMTYTALLSLTILRDDFSGLHRRGLIKFLRSTQHPDGSFSPLPIGTVSSESDLRLTFCAFAICYMLGNWTGIDIDKAVQFIMRCRTYEGGYGESPGREAQGENNDGNIYDWAKGFPYSGGPTYCALASLRMASSHPITSADWSHRFKFSLSPLETEETLRWLIQKQRGGFQGRTEKKPDACYCFWCGASIKLLEGDEYVDNDANAAFLLSCQYKYGGIAKEPGETPDPYHTYLSLASLSLYPPTKAWLEENKQDASAWGLHQLDPLLNLRLGSAHWAMVYIPKRDIPAE